MNTGGSPLDQIQSEGYPDEHTWLVGLPPNPIQPDLVVLGMKWD